MNSDAASVVAEAATVRLRPIVRSWSSIGVENIPRRELEKMLEREVALDVDRPFENRVIGARNTHEAILEERLDVMVRAMASDDANFEIDLRAIDHECGRAFGHECDLDARCIALQETHEPSPDRAHQRVGRRDHEPTGEGAHVDLSAGGDQAGGLLQELVHACLQLERERGGNEALTGSHQDRIVEGAAESGRVSG